MLYTECLISAIVIHSKHIQNELFGAKSRMMLKSAEFFLYITTKRCKLHMAT